MKNKIVIISTLCLALLVACNQNNVSLSPTDFAKAINADNEKMIIDVRTPGEFSSGYIAGATNIDIYSKTFDEEISAIDKSTPVYLYCKSGGRSSDAASRLTAAGFKQVYDLDGGLIQWTNNDLPLAGLPEKTTTQYSLEAYFDYIKTHDVVLVDFFATWCGPCKLMAPHIKAIHEKYPDLNVLKVDTDKSQALARHFQISGIPLVKVYANGDEVYDKMGYHSEEELLEVVTPYL